MPILVFIAALLGLDYVNLGDMGGAMILWLALATAYKGLVSGAAIHGVDVGKDFKAFGRNLGGGPRRRLRGGDRQESERGHGRDAAAAEDLGAKAVVATSIDLEGVGTNTSMFLVTVSGTAAVVRPV